MFINLLPPRKKCSNPTCLNLARDTRGTLPATLGFFFKSKTGKLGIHPKCKECKLRQDKEYVAKNKPVFLAKCKEYREKHKEAVSATKKRWYQEHREHTINRVKNYEKTHREQVRVAKARYEKRRLKEDIEFRLVYLLRRRLNKALKGLAKASTTMTLVGCSPLELRQHFESKFQPGMTWNNQGQWHIDHIKPCESFDFSRPEQQNKCFHYTNLQPLWARDNLAKGSRIVP